MKEKSRVYNVDTLVSSTKTLYNYIHQGLLEIKSIDLPISVRSRKKPSTKKHLGKSIEERPKEINNRSRFVLECMKKSITADNGSEFSSLSEIEGLDVYLTMTIHFMNEVRMRISMEC